MAFSTKEFEWSDNSIIWLGKTVAGVQDIEYSYSQQKDYVYGRGNEPLSIQSGNKEYKGSISILRSEYDAFIKAVKATNPLYGATDVSFDIVSCYEKNAVGKVSSDTLVGVEIEEVTKGMKQGDAFEVIKLPIKFLGIKEIPAV